MSLVLLLQLVDLVEVLLDDNDVWLYDILDNGHITPTVVVIVVVLVLPFVAVIVFVIVLVLVLALILILALARGFRVLGRCC